MFQTEPILYLQSQGSDWLTAPMALITSMGTAAFFAAVIIAVTFGIDFRKGFLLFQLLLWTGAATEILKVVFALPRPDFVDLRVLNLEKGLPNTSPFSGQGGEGFFALPEKEALEAFGAQVNSIASSSRHGLYGFPSGHVSTTTALWGGAALIFGNRAIRGMAPAVVLLMAFSRMYLGRHFLGDVLGGFMLGLIMLFAFSAFLGSRLNDDFFRKESFLPSAKFPNGLFYLFMFIVPLLLAASSMIGHDVAGFLMGTNAAYILVVRKGIPDDSGTAGQRTTRAMMALLTFATAAAMLAAGINAAGIENSLNPGVIEFAEAFIPATTVWVSVIICSRLGLYGKART
ncbi:phosphatase PAP2 family protein [Methanosarcina sp. KYL-1]|uniref:phosphatase PAP2 family protein n=1 Tax=Methanosarcina sp. KYL-1 TaxID=2602068 RepID=UPI0021016C36|nr:phosphatase PAP2 family protein [Methanosarcina sp. KYL-1]MCQ1537238.1 phosphatase PAP2 family protein [Methanosarcina sp. KYL-1]